MAVYFIHGLLGFAKFYPCENLVLAPKVQEPWGCKSKNCKQNNIYGDGDYHRRC